MFDVEAVRARLPNRRVDWFATTQSTMLEARAAMEPGRVIVADEQTGGMGRHGRTWHSKASEGLYVSIVLGTRPVPVMMLALGLATREAITKITGLDADLRWPNDVMLDGKKCAGVLAQVDGGAVIAGIGINVTQREFPDGLETPATSLTLSGAAVSREDLLVALIEAVDEFTSLPHDAILRAFTESSSYAVGRRVRAGDREGVTCGLDPSGFLRLREDNGTETMILAGGVRPI